MSTSIIDIFKADCPRRLDKIQLKYAENPPVEKNGITRIRPFCVLLMLGLAMGGLIKWCELWTSFASRLPKTGISTKSNWFKHQITAFFTEHPNTPL